MTDSSPDLFEVSGQDFQQLVIEQSHQTPVLVDFWADWCAPCKMLIPVLAKLVGEYQGRFKLAKVNTDVERELAAANGIRSLPTLRLYQHGEVVEEVLGAQPESVLRQLLDAHIERASDSTLAEALALAAGGNDAQAFQVIEQASHDDPDNPRLPLEHARLAIKAKRLDRAQEILADFPAGLAAQPESKALKLVLELASEIEDAPSPASLQKMLDADPARSEPRYQLAVSQALAGNYDSALDNLMELLKRDRGYRDGIAQRAMVALLTLLGNEDPRVAGYRRQMFALLH
ncbi:MAG: thioredoxin [Thiogranum sp.]|nr:thioredoxin [Thiogranum sp.]